MRRAVLLAAAGAALGFAAEVVHRRAGVWVLDAGGAMPAWVALIYFAGLLSAALAFRRLPRVRVAPDRLLVEAALVAAAFLAPIALHEHEFALLAVTLA